MPQPTPTAVRSYRLYFRDASNLLANPHDVDLASVEDARQLAVLMLDKEITFPCAEVWDRARLVCTMRRDG